MLRDVAPRIVLLTAFAVACGPASPDAELVTSAEASAAIESSLDELGASFIGGDANGSLAVALPSATCVTASPDPQSNLPGNTGGTTTYHFGKCTAPFGLTSITGDVVIAWSISGPTFHYDLTASSLTLGNATITQWTASADVTAAGAQRTMVWQSTASGERTLHGSTRSFQRTVDATLTWQLGASCVAIDSQGSGTIETSSGEALDVSTRASSYVACANACPSSGSEVRADDLDHPGVFVRVKYDASGTATYTNDRGQTFSFVPACATP